MARSMVSFDLDPAFLRMVEQRATQEGISRADYIRECIALEMAFSGDLEAMKFVFKRSGKRVKESLMERIVGADIQGVVDALAK